MKINWNKVAREVALAEGQKQQVSIAQIKEIINDLCHILNRDYPSWAILEGVGRLSK